ncbi:MAG: bifunctional phosphopantothenoylcysteine decarboxylase/phosphopantothenate synthase [Erythrobacter sp.]|uniref:bifunctional phosphopantothenoylcysteine decarboxylase/phosphopantothenate synthase n=1 Tax=Erythrobacter sp. TaxID=1042 RepID=UPI002604DA13|nr:bifunctional phosphopantothenoylcysteine decarboxylase/phosphopantothenate synthase [Erythrobacter sp.]MDJ0979315.1 bifunctional phosphopantothenoylcysteine decarboxylase/phosphopantothenate synthase [Erythrobacter sp.]
MSTAPVEVVAPRVLLVVGGGIAAYKACELVRLIRKGGGDVTCVVTKGGQQFVTPMSLAALSENQVYTTLWDLKNEAEMGHIQLSREADLIVVCPATADLMAKMAAGIADDLATTLILATDKPVMAIPAMNVRMWEHESTQRNIEALKTAGVEVLHPDEGPMACGEFGYGRLPEPGAIWRAIAGHFGLEVAEETPAPAAANDSAATVAPVEAVEPVEALEPDDNDSALSGGLGGLLSRIIPRSTAKRSHEEIETEYEELEIPEGFDPDEPLPELPGDEIPEFDPEGAGPLLAKKGSAASAPPIDPEALNHEVNDRQSPPEDISEPEPEPVDETAEAPDADAEAPAEPKKGKKAKAAPVELEPVEDAASDALGGEAFEVDADYTPLSGKHVVVTAGPTWEAIDPVRYIANRSSGKQGFAIAAAAAALGAQVTLIAGPVALKTPKGVDRIDVESAAEMNQAVRQALPADAAVMVAAVADWRPRQYVGEKIKKRGSAPPALMLTENPDILTNLAASEKRPELVIGFAAETEDVIGNAKSKRKRKAADWIIANDVSGDVMGGDDNEVHIVSTDGVESLDKMPKHEVAMALARRIAETLTAEAAE